MRSSFDYKKAKLEAEKMLEVIERDPQSPWENSIKGLVPIIYSLAISGTVMSILANSINENNKVENNKA